MGKTIAYLGFNLERMDDGRLLGIGYTDPFTFPLDLINFENSPGEILGPADGASPFASLAEVDGVLYGVWGSSQPEPHSETFVIDSKTRAVTTLATIQGTYVHELAIDEAGNAFAVITVRENGEWVERLQRIDLLTGALTEIGLTLPDIVGMDFLPDGTLMGFGHNGRLATIDTATGAYTLGPQLNFGPGSWTPADITFVVPEPGTVLVLLGGLGLICARRKRK